MRRYIHALNIAHFATLLDAETAPKKRATLMKLLVGEEDQLGSSHEDLRQADARIAIGQQLIERQRALITLLSGDGRDTKDARTCLVRLMEVQTLFVSYREKIIDRIGRNFL